MAAEMGLDTRNDEDDGEEHSSFQEPLKGRRKKDSIVKPVAWAGQQEVRSF